MGIRMLHRRTAHARVHATAATTSQANPAATPFAPLPALAPGAATPRIPGTPLTALREATAPLRRGLPHPTRRLWPEPARSYLALALATLSRLPRRRTARRRPLTVFVATMPLTERPDGPSRR